jgi:hypothetical protein
MRVHRCNLLYRNSDQRPAEQVSLDRLNKPRGTSTGTAGVVCHRLWRATGVEEDVAGRR